MNVFWMPLAAASAHIFEEFVWPGRFAAWYRSYRPDIAPSMTGPFLVWINGALLFGCFAVGVDEKTIVGPAFFLAMCGLLAGNAVFHLAATLRKHQYSPGVVTGTLFYLPLAAYGYWSTVNSGRISIAAGGLALALGSSYHFISLANHKRRARAI